MTKTPRNTPRHTIEIVAFPDVQLLDVTGPMQVFASANEMTRLSGKAPYYAIRVVAKSSPVVSSSGLALLAEALSPQKRPIDTLIVAGGAGVHAASQDTRLIPWLIRRASAAKRIAPFARVRGFKRCAGACCARLASRRANTARGSLR